jgi:hypothetical protein
VLAVLPRRTQKNATRRRAILAESLEPLRGGLKTLMKSTVARFCHEELRLRYDVERVGDTDPPSTGGRGVRRPCGRLGGAVAMSLFSMAIRNRRGKQVAVRRHICKNRVLLLLVFFWCSSGVLLVLYYREEPRRTPEGRPPPCPLLPLDKQK